MSTNLAVDTPSHGGPSAPQEIKLLTEIPGPRSKALMERKTTAIPRGIGMALPVFVQAAGGGVIVDVDGNSLIDLASGIAVTSVGNAAPAVVEAVVEQASRFTHTSFSVTGYEGYVRVAETLNSITPGTHVKRTALFNSGAEAIENAIKIARIYSGRQAVAAFDHAYHGRTNLTMALTSKSMPFKSGFGPFAPEVYRAPASYPYRDGLSGADAAEKAIAQLEKQVGAANLAAVIIEPIQGEGGFIVPAPGFLKAIEQWARANDVLFIADEIQTGFARTGDMFACENEGVVPDLIATAKGIAGGLPLSAVTGRADVMDASHPGGLGGTYGGNPLACAAALATIRMYQDENLSLRAREIGSFMRARLAEFQGADKRIGDVRGRGAMQAIELVDPATGAPDAAYTNRVAEIARSRGLVLLTCGTHGNVIRFLPPLTISDDLLAVGFTILQQALAEA
jgi:4-aminobutyrate aminotransferase/(S)-3-amino-2-methylpropionate transaminase